ncbi:hypothetical protein P280DRAFT_329015 [Massarina eburnea CBS 473.64]|uniref:DUF1640-domain-containing protein n=1 Tax=Massarina eburnea CBS 473.64 TaxID=1395130 RepID=A0A6A6S2A5_9PLEO|nr:hypothetical protein P280DRAFT_329015 [Massarina eburnea CBS 473.64]
MAAPRLPFLWPMLFRPLKATRPHAHVPKPTKTAARRFATTPRRREEVTQRYGTAHQPAPHLRDQDAEKKDPKTESKTNTSAPEQENVDEEEEDETPPSTIPPSQSKMKAETPETAPPTPPPDPPKTADFNPLETVLHMPSPADKPPHLKTPPYVHHFDTYSLVKDLTTSGFSQPQSVTIMKAVRGILSDNMELARDGLVSKSNVENETYLFRAACSELKTEVGGNRKAETERMRSERGQLQHEVDLLGQRLGQEMGFLKDELKGLFDDRKMAVRQEQRVKETKLQELNNQITIKLTSDARSEVEGLRWVLTRRAALTLGICAFMLFVSLRYSSYVSHQSDKEKKRKEEKKPPSDGGQGPPANGKPASSANEPLGSELLATEGGVSLA